MQESPEKEGSQYTEVNHENIKDFIAAMEEHRKKCEEAGNYVEAEMAKNRIVELREQEYNMAYQQLFFAHQQRQEEIQQAHIKQYQEFNAHWDNILQKAQEDDQNEIIELENRHTRDLEKNRGELEQKLPLTFKFSAELLNLRKIQQNLAKQKDYKEAHQVQMRANEIEERERQIHLETRHKKILALEAKLMQKQQNEMNALRKKLEGRMNDRLKLREQEHNQIIQTYENSKKSIENRQNLERNKLEKEFRTRPQTASGRQSFNPNQSQMSNMSGRKRRGAR